MAFKKTVYRIFDHSPNLALFAALLGSAFLALSPTFIRYSEVGVTATAFYRFFFALPMAWTLMIFDNTSSTQPRTPHSVKEYLLLMFAGIFLAIDIFFWHISIVSTSTLNAMILNAMTPILVAVAAIFILNEKLTNKLIIGICITIAGVVLLISVKSNNGHNIIGDFYAFCSAIFYAAFIICAKKLRSTFSAPTIMFWVSLSGMYVLGFLAYGMNETLFPTSSFGWLLLIALSFIVHILGNGLLSYSMGHLSSTLSSLTILIGPFVASVIGYYIYDEQFHQIQIMGGIIIAVGIFIARYKNTS